MTPPLLAVHIADGVLSWPWLAAGFAVIGALAAIACWRLREDEVPRGKRKSVGHERNRRAIQVAHSPKK